MLRAPGVRFGYSPVLLRVSEAEDREGLWAVKATNLVHVPKQAADATSDGGEFRRCLRGAESGGARRAFPPARTPQWSGGCKSAPEKAISPFVYAYHLDQALVKPEEGLQLQADLATPNHTDLDISHRFFHDIVGPYDGTGKPQGWRSRSLQSSRPQGCRDSASASHYTSGVTDDEEKSDRVFEDGGLAAWGHPEAVHGQPSLLLRNIRLDVKVVASGHEGVEDSSSLPLEAEIPDRRVTPAINH